MRQLCTIIRLVVLLHLLATVAFAAAAAAPTSAEAEHSTELAQEISENVMSPFCPGRTLAACPSEDARKLREQIVRWIADGYSTSAVYGLLETTYGQEVRGIPRSSGFGLVGWIAPPIFLVLLSFGVWRMLKRLQRTQPAQPAGAAPSPSRTASARVADELAERMRR